jgi:sugar phosphate isomerase/epimerase
MLYGGHVKSLDDIGYLQDLKFDLGEVIFRNAESRAYWLHSGVTNGLDSRFFLIAHGPREGPPNDIDHLWKHYYPALLETVGVAHSLGIEFLTIHLWMDPRFVGPDAREEKKSFLNTICAYGHENGVVISLENLSETATDLGPILEANPELGLTLDVGHGQLLTETNTSFDIIEKLSASIKHIHIHDNRGGRGVEDDLHLPIGEGIVDFQGILRRLAKKGYDGTATLELERDVLESSRQRIRQIVHDLAITILAHERQGQPRESLDVVKRRMRRKGKPIQTV